MCLSFNDDMVLAVWDVFDEYISRAGKPYDGIEAMRQAINTRLTAANLLIVPREVVEEAMHNVAEHGWSYEEDPGFALAKRLFAIAGVPFPFTQPDRKEGM